MKKMEKETQTTDFIMDDKDFNNLKIDQSLKEVALPALKLRLKTAWDEVYPDKPMNFTTEWVKQFEEKEEEIFQERTSKISNKSHKQAKINKKKKSNYMKSEESWKNGNWDISKVGYALVDSGIFKLDNKVDNEDEEGVPESEHIKEITKLRNEVAHSTNSYEDDATEEKILTLDIHIKSLKIPQTDKDRFSLSLNRIHSKEKPVSGEEMRQMKTEYTEMKHQNDLLVMKEQLHKRFSTRECNMQDSIERKERLIDYLRSENSSQKDCEKDLRGKYSNETAELKKKLQVKKKEYARKIQAAEDKCSQLDNELKDQTESNSKLKKKLEDQEKVIATLLKTYEDLRKAAAVSLKLSATLTAIVAEQEVKNERMLSRIFEAQHDKISNFIIVPAAAVCITTAAYSHPTFTTLAILSLLSIIH